MICTLEEAILLEEQEIKIANLICENHRLKGLLNDAGPEMLEALEWLSNEIDCRDDEYGMVCFTHDDLRKVKAAIKKARGEEWRGEE